MKNEWNYLVLFFMTIELRIILNYRVERNDVDFVVVVFDLMKWDIGSVLQVFEELFFPNIDDILSKFFQNLHKNKNGQKF